MKLDYGNLTDSLVVWLNKYLENMRATGDQESTIQLNSRILNSFIDYANHYIDEYDIKSINRLFINGYILSKQGKLNNNTQATHLKIIRTFFNFISDNNDEGYNFRGIFKKIKIKVPQRQRNHLDEDEVNRLLNILELEKSKRHSYIAFRNALLIKIMLYSGARVSEAIHIKYSDIMTSETDDKFYKIIIIGKGDKQDYLYIKKELIDDELDFIRSCRRIDKITGPDKISGSNSDYIFLTSHGEVIDRTNVFRIVKRLFKLARINKSGVHIFRHTLAMRLVERNVNILNIQKIMRHSSIQTTMVYARSSEKNSIDALKMLK